MLDILLADAREFSLFVSTPNLRPKIELAYSLDTGSIAGYIGSRMQSDEDAKGKLFSWDEWIRAVTWGLEGFNSVVPLVSIVKFCMTVGWLDIGDKHSEKPDDIPWFVWKLSTWVLLEAKDDDIAVIKNLLATIRPPYWYDLTKEHCKTQLVGMHDWSSCTHITLIFGGKFTSGIHAIISLNFVEF